MRRGENKNLEFVIMNEKSRGNLSIILNVGVQAGMKKEVCEKIVKEIKSIVECEEGLWDNPIVLRIFYRKLVVQTMGVLYNKT